MDEPCHFGSGQCDMKLLHGIERLVARRRVRRATDEVELLMEPARVRGGAVAGRDADAVEQDAQRLVLARRTRAEHRVVDDEELLPRKGRIDLRVDTVERVDELPRR